MTSGLRHTAHPLQFRTIEIISPGYLRLAVVDTLLTFLQIVAIVTAIGIDGPVVELQDHGAHPVQEESVVGHHQQRLVAPVQESLQPLYHLQVQVVRGLVENQQVGVGNQHISQRHALLLSSAQLSHGLVEVSYLQLRQDLLGLEHLLRVTLMIETRIEHALHRVEHRRLFQHPHLQVPAEDDVARVIALLTREHRQQRRLARTVLRYQPHLLPFGNREADILKQHQ